MNTKKKILKIALIGLGRIGWQTHIPEILKHDNFELTAVVDPLEERLREARDTFKIKKLYQNTDALFANESPDLTVIASPTKFHHSQTLQAFANGSDVFCDKPAAMSLAEIDDMIGSMHKYQRKLMVFQPHRTHATTQALRDILADDLIGRVFMVKHSVMNYTRRSDWQAYRKNGGGMLYNYGAHYIDQLLHLLQTRCRSVYCRVSSILSAGDADDVVKALINTENGVLLDLDINMACTQNISPWLICGTLGSVVYDEEKSTWKVKYCLQGDLPLLKAESQLAATNRMYTNGEKIPWRKKYYHQAEYKRLDYYRKCYEYFALDKPAFVPIEETREVMRVLEMCQQSSQGNANA